MPCVCSWAGHFCDQRTQGECRGPGGRGSCHLAIPSRVNQAHPPALLGLSFAFCHVHPFLGSTSRVSKASLRQSTQVRCSAQCPAPCQHPINAHFCPKCYLQPSLVSVQPYEVPAVVMPQVGAPGPHHTVQSPRVPLCMHPQRQTSDLAPTVRAGQVQTALSLSAGQEHPPLFQ